MTMAMAFGGVKNTHSINSFRIASSSQEDTAEIQGLSAWIWEISSEKPMEGMQHGETEIH